MLVEKHKVAQKGNIHYVANYFFDGLTENCYNVFQIPRANKKCGQCISTAYNYGSVIDTVNGWNEHTNLEEICNTFKELERCIETRYFLL